MLDDYLWTNWILLPRASASPLLFRDGRTLEEVPSAKHLRALCIVRHQDASHLFLTDPAHPLVIMEGIEAFDRHDYRGNAYASRRTDARRCSPGLPTPEASRSSAGSIDEQYAQTFARRGVPVHAMLSRDSPESTKSPTEMASQLRNVSSMRRDSRHYNAPHSPPYQAADMQKPSLPPLKTVRSWRLGRLLR